MEAITYKAIQPGGLLSDFVESFWMLANESDEPREIVLLPDGRIDLVFSPVAGHGTVLLGLETEASPAGIAPRETMFAVSFKLLAVEYLLGMKSTSFLNSVYEMPAGYLGIHATDLADFDSFCAKASQSLLAALKKGVDEKKRRLFAIIYASQGSVTVNEISKAVGWNSRQINRYFNERFGLSLKAYCNILRFRASFSHIKAGRLYPEQDFADQAHFIKDVRKYTGVTPRALMKNNNDRFIQFSLLHGT